VYKWRKDLSGEEKLNESQWIGDARRGDGAAWEALVRGHQESVFRLAFLFLGDADEAADVAQEAFVRAYLALGRFDASRPLRPWLLRIAANLARNRRRAAGRYSAALQRTARADPEAMHGATQSRLEDGRAADAERLWRAVRRLRQADQEVITMRYFLELSEAETAHALRVAAGTVKSRTHRALRRLRAVIEREFPDLTEGSAA